MVSYRFGEIKIIDHKLYKHKLYSLSCFKITRGLCYENYLIYTECYSTKYNWLSTFCLLLKSC